MATHFIHIFESAANRLMVFFKQFTIKTTWFKLMLMGLIYGFNPVHAQITKPKIGGKELSGDDPIADLGIVIGGAGGLTITVIQIAVYVVAAYLIVVGLITGWKKSEWGQFFIGIILAIVMFVVSTYFLSQGESALDGLAS